MSPSSEAVAQIYFNYQTNLNAMVDACPQQTDKDYIANKLTQARTNYFACLNKSFQEHDPELKVLVTQAQGSAETLKHIEDHLAEVSKVIDVVTDAVTVGSKIAAKVIAL
jgi:hypothetical protein